MAKILVVDDEKNIRNTLREILEYEKYDVDEAENGKIALEQFKSNVYDVVLCDIKMPQISGALVLEEMKKINSDTPIVMISGHGNIETAVDLIKNGAYDYISKPLDLNRLLITIKNALDKSFLIKETSKLKKKLDINYEMIGNSKQINDLKDIIAKVAPTEARVLITGENGTGKELVARAIHNNSTRVNAPFIEVNCAAIPSELIESQLFGHEKGAFTSAIKQRKGDFEQADGGTIFLDEIGDMSLSAQAKVLRALQENKIVRVGGEKEITVDVRVIAATNKDLNKEISNNNFREDLFHRLSVILIKVPKLNERKDDIPILANYFLENICQSYGIPMKEFTEGSLDELKKIEWTGNIRELKNVVERLVILCDNIIEAKDIIKYANPHIK
ncbi:MAG: Fis family transcriptional regulator [Bacteroidetes bacterium GWF2_29_10]|nr:MAG: Fis family transcriptional regulator [Bacteroidetes bacterium GWF2_29_10]